MILVSFRPGDLAIQYAEIVSGKTLLHANMSANGCSTPFRVSRDQKRLNKDIYIYIHIKKGGRTTMDAADPALRAVATERSKLFLEFSRSSRLRTCRSLGRPWANAPSTKPKTVVCFCPMGTGGFPLPKNNTWTGTLRCGVLSFY